MRTLIISAFLISNAILLSAQSKDIVLKTSTGEIYGTEISPANNTSNTVALIIGGSGPTDRDGNNPMMKNNSLKYLAEDLAKEGIATVRFDKRGIAASAASGTKEVDLRFTNYIDDAKEWVSQLSKSYKNIVVIGHSEGALIGTVCTKGNKDVKALISIAGIGNPSDVVLKRQLAQQPQQVKDIAFPIIDSLKCGKLVENVPQLFYALFRPDVQPYLISMFEVNPQKEISQVSQPILIVQGDKDIQVSIEDAELLHKAQPKSQLKIIENMNHVLKECTTTDQASQINTYTNPDNKNKAELGKYIIEFIKTL